MARVFKIEDYKGKVYNKLTVISEDEPYRSPKGDIKRVVICQCECGNITSKRLDKVLLGKFVSCGCQQSKSLGHSINRTPSYRSWTSMMQRCVYMDNPDYKLKGITVCERWKTYSNFFEDMGERPKGMTLDRIDPYGNYEPGNVKWSTPKEQRFNQKDPLLVCPICGYEIKNGYKFNMKQHIEFKHPDSII
jgi:hypothetical protein